MDCREANRQLQLYIDDQLTLGQMRVLESHVAGCADCREELAFLETIAQQFDMVQSVAEPEDMHEQIMLRVAMAAPRSNPQPFFPWHPSLTEWLAAILLATIATLGSILSQPSLRNLLPIANGHDSLSIAFINLLHVLTSMNSSTLTIVLWIFGTILGVSITLAFAGTELRSRWFKAMTDRLQVR